MSNQGSDNVSSKLSQQYAWRLQGLDEKEASAGTAQGIVVVEEAAEAEDVAAADGESPLDELQQYALQPGLVDEVAALTDEAWGLSAASSTDAQQELTETLIGQASSSPVLIAKLSVKHPLQTVRLLRLVRRYHRVLDASVQDQLSEMCLFASFTHPETTELLVELAQAGELEFAHRLGFALRALEPDDETPQSPALLEYHQLTPRLCAIIDNEAASWDSRALATEWLLLSCTIAALPTLRRALRLPHQGVRWRALAVLLYSFSPAELQAEDLQFLIDDLFEHPPLSLRDTLVLNRPGLGDYADTLTAAILRLRPPGVAQSLLRLLRGENVSRALYRSPCGDGWALATLAGGYPEQALQWVDRDLSSSYSLYRYRGIGAVRELPEALARPRLFRAAMDAAPLVASGARRAWEQRYGSPFEPGLELTGDLTARARLELGPLADLLESPPSEAMFSRLAILRGESEEARQAMLEVLLDEAPAQESLALLVFAMADSSLLLTRLRKRLPKDYQALCRAVCRRFGAPGLRALCLLADCYPGPNGDGGLLPLLGIARRSRLRRADLAPLRELAARRLQTSGPEAGHTALMILQDLGAPDSLREHLLARVETNDPRALYYAAAGVLAQRPRDRELAASLPVRIEAAYQAQDMRMLRHLVVALPSRAAWAQQLARSILSRWSAQGSAAPMNCDTKEMHWQDAAEHCLKLLHTANLLPPHWLDAALQAPEHRDFLIATGLLREDSDLTPARRAALAAALVSTAHGGAAALESAVTLLRLNQETTEDDPRLLHLLAKTQGEWRARLLGMMLYRQPLTLALQPFLEQCLCTEDPEEAESMMSDLHRLIAEGHRELLSQLLPKIQVAALANELRHELSPRHEVSSYWCDKQPSRRRRSS